eukprot:Skav226396  [mRNA]  locus=scaffold3989:26729:28475:- [translate_table: standard]
MSLCAINRYKPAIPNPYQCHHQPPPPTPSPRGGPPLQDQSLTQILSKICSALLKLPLAPDTSVRLLRQQMENRRGQRSRGGGAAGVMADGYGYMADCSAEDCTRSGLSASASDFAERRRFDNLLHRPRPGAADDEDDGAAERQRRALAKL